MRFAWALTWRVSLALAAAGAAESVGPDVRPWLPGGCLPVAGLGLLIGWGWRRRPAASAWRMLLAGAGAILFPPGVAYGYVVAAAAAAPAADALILRRPRRRAEVAYTDGERVWIAER